MRLSRPVEVLGAILGASLQIIRRHIVKEQVVH
jgi:hypothetical protein